MEKEIKCPKCGSIDFFIVVRQLWVGYSKGAAIIAHRTGERITLVSCNECHHGMDELINKVEIKFE